MSDRYKIQRFESREAWLLARQNGIGASESAAVVGLSSWRSAYAVWVDKTEPPVFEPMDEIARWGLILEPVILAEFCKQSGIAAERQPSGSLWSDPERPYIVATPDALTSDGEPVELKTAHFASAKTWEKEVPLPYMVQVQHQLHVTDAKQGYIAVLVDGYQFAWHRVPRHQRFIDKLMRKLDHFWNEHVVKRVPPPVDYHRATTQALLKKYPTTNGKVVELPDEMEPLYSEFETVAKTIKDAEKRKDEIANAIRERIGDARYGRFLNGTGWQWSGTNGKRQLRKCPKCPEPTGHD